MTPETTTASASEVLASNLSEKAPEKASEKTLEKVPANAALENLPSRRLAAIDIGTVTCRMLVADVTAQGSIFELDREYAITNLGEGVDATGVLKPEAMQRVAHAIDNYLSILDSFRTPQHADIPLVVMATSAVRDAKNALQFSDLLAQRGVELSVIPGEREAALSFLGASSEFAGENIIVVDIGGGSTEVIAGRAGQEPAHVHSFNIGCRRITERFFASDPPAPAEIEHARSWVRQEMNVYFAHLQDSYDRLVAVAGTATSVVSIREHMETYDSTRVHKAQVSRETLNGICTHLQSLPLDVREQVVGLDPGRAPVIVAGLIILQEVCALAHLESFTVSESDILHGILLDAAGKSRL